MIVDSVSTQEPRFEHVEGIGAGATSSVELARLTARLDFSQAETSAARS